MNDRLMPGEYMASVPAHVIRHVANHVARMGHDPVQLCRGLGFSFEDLQSLDFRVSYRQTRNVVLRAMKLLGNPGMGVQVGGQQTLVSFGLPGLGMMTCETLGEALEYLLGFQTDAGAFTETEVAIDGPHFVVDITTCFHDPELEHFFVEEVMSSGIALIRSLIGNDFEPLSVSLAYPEPAHREAYAQHFRCPLHFNTGRNQAIIDARILATPLPTCDRYMKDIIQSQLAQLLTPIDHHPDLVESIKTYLHAHIESNPTIAAVAASLNLSERTLRRRLKALDVSFQSLLDEVRYQHARQMLCKTDMVITDIALALGFNDDKNFRRAFRRWSGGTPSAVREMGRG
ncbi:AraC family transcriptional regulator [Burkholderiaceae bacterium DAT-1]|nr:AraC family transcriptional regulator [Burkholderiaceae bacterium DAT-1]